jgi:hypothetical protein
MILLEVKDPDDYRNLIEVRKIINIEETMYGTKIFLDGGIVIETLQEYEEIKSKFSELFANVE